MVRAIAERGENTPFLPDRAVPKAVRVTTDLAEALEIAWGQALMEAKNYAEAEAVLRKAVKNAPKRPGARIALADVAASTDLGIVAGCECDPDPSATCSTTPPGTDWFIANSPFPTMRIASASGSPDRHCQGIQVA